MLKATTLFLGAVTMASAMHMGEINLNNTDIDAQLRFDMGQFNRQITPDTIFVGARYLNVDESHGDFGGSKGLYELSYMMQQQVGRLQALKLGIGFKFNYLSAGDDRYTSLPLGVEGSYRLPVAGPFPLYAGGKFYYAPEVLSFNKAKNYLEFGAHLDAELIENGRLTAGYRQIETDFTAHDITYNAAWYVGFKFRF